MKQYIDRSALVAEIKKLKGKVDDESSYCNGWQQALRMLEMELDILEVKEEAFNENTQQLIGSYTTEVETGDGGIKALVRKELRAPIMDYEKKIREYMNSSKLYKDFLSILFPELTELEPKFKVGDWVIVERKTLYRIEKVTELPYNHYQYWTTDGHWFGDGTESHLWTIQDAKDGDVLVHNECTFIFMGIKDGVVKAFEENLLDGTNPVNFGEPDKDKDYCPATKEQRDTLFAKMKEAGCEWDAEKKELKRIGQKHSIDINKMVDDYANNKERGNEEFGKPVPCMIRAYRQGLNDAIGKVVLNPAWSEEDEDILNEVIRHFDGIPLKHPMHKVIGWLFFIKQRIKD